MHWLLPPSQYFNTKIIKSATNYQSHAFQTVIMQFASDPMCGMNECICVFMRPLPCLSLHVSVLIIKLISLNLFLNCIYKACSYILIQLYCRLWVVPVLLSPSSETVNKSQGKMAAWNPGAEDGGRHAWPEGPCKMWMPWVDGNVNALSGWRIIIIIIINNNNNNNNNK